MSLSTGEHGRILAIDYGERRIGLAISDPTRTIASPAGVIVRRASDVAPGDDVEVLLHEGRLDCRVTATKEHDGRPQV